MTDTLAPPGTEVHNTESHRHRAAPGTRTGFPVVLTADRTLMARYRVLFDGMMSTSQTARTPSLLVRTLLAPRLPSQGLRAGQAPLGLRRIESALRLGGWGTEEVAVVTPTSLDGAVGPRTQVIGISSGDPLGLGMSSTTVAAVTGGEPYTSSWFRALTGRVRELRRQAPEARVVVGGPGAWQLAQDDDARRGLGIDHVVTGYSEGNAAELFGRLADGAGLPPIVEGVGVAAEGIPTITGPTVMGAVETSRGCGLGCDFCTIAQTPMRHLPVETILADVQTNLAAGVAEVSLVSEDLFRYGAQGPRPQPEALLDLLRRVRELEDVGLVQTDHANVASVARFSDAQLREVHRLLAGDRRQGYVWLNLGVETASGELLAANGGQAKMEPYGPEQWGELCHQQVRRLCSAGFFPMVSLVLGLPGETPEHVEETTRWVRQLKGERVSVVPLFRAPLLPEEPAFGLADMTRAHWQLFRECYRLNFKWLPRLCWDNQTGAGVGLWRRLLIQALGRMNVLWWKGLFVWRSGRLLA